MRRIFLRLVYKEKWHRHFSTLDLLEQIRAVRHLQRARSAKFPAPLTTSAEREVPRATCNECGARSSPRRNLRASPMKEKRLGRFSPPDLFEQIRAVRRIFLRLVYKEKCYGHFSTLDLFEQIRAVVVRGTSVYPSLPYFCCAKIRGFCAKMRHGIRAVH